jgi:hypothetical protein
MAAPPWHPQRHAQHCSVPARDTAHPARPDKSLRMPRMQAPPKRIRTQINEHPPDLRQVSPPPGLGNTSSGERPPTPIKGGTPGFMPCLAVRREARLFAGAPIVWRRSRGWVRRLQVGGKGETHKEERVPEGSKTPPPAGSVWCNTICMDPGGLLSAGGGPIRTRNPLLLTSCVQACLGQIRRYKAHWECYPIHSDRLPFPVQQAPALDPRSYRAPFAGRGLTE